MNLSWISRGFKYVLIVFAAGFSVDFGFAMTSSKFQANMLGVAPRRMQILYVDFILNERFGLLRSGRRKCRIVRMLGAAQEHHINISYDVRRLAFYASAESTREHKDLCLDEPTRAIAGRLLFSRRDVRMVEAIFHRYQDDDLSMRYLCGSLRSVSALPAAVQAVAEAKCPDVPDIAPLFPDR